MKAWVSIPSGDTVRPDALAEADEVGRQAEHGPVAAALELAREDDDRLGVAARPGRGEGDAHGSGRPPRDGELARPGADGAVGGVARGGTVPVRAARNGSRSSATSSVSSSVMTVAARGASRSSASSPKPSPGPPSPTSRPSTT